MRSLYRLLVCLIGLSLEGLILILFCNYYSRSIEVYHTDDSLHEAKITLSRVVQERSSRALTNSSVSHKSYISTSSIFAEKSVSVSHTEIQNVNNKTIQLIPQKSNQVNSINTSQVTLTRYLYEPGFDIPNINVCPDFGEKLKLFVAITSAPTNHEARMAVRRTWGHNEHRNDVAVGFLLGISNDSNIDNSVRNESELYRDIICGRFIDSFDNLTLKTVSLTEWVDYYCRKVRYVLKTDDDVYINMPKLLKFVDQHLNESRIIYGRLAKNYTIDRNCSSKYFIPVDQFAGDSFPDFVTGPAYLLPGAITRDLYMQALQSNYLKLEDVFMTGIVAEKIGVKRLNIVQFANKQYPINTYLIDQYFNMHGINNYRKQFHVWRALFDRQNK